MQRFREILVLAPPGDVAPAIVGRAAELAERNRARLTLFDAVPALDDRRRRLEHAGTELDLQELVVETRLRELQELAERVMTVDVRTVVEVGVPFAAVIERVLRYGHDLVIVAPDRSERRGGLTGATTTLHLLRKCPVPVWVDDPATWGRPDVLVALGSLPDGGGVGELNRTLLELGSSLARIQGGEVHLVHAWRLEGEHLLRNSRVRIPGATVDALVDDERRDAEAALARVLDQFDFGGAQPRLHLRPGRPADVIGDVVTEVAPAVVVMGTLARTGLQGLIIGNTAERVLGVLDAGVLAVKPPGFTSPVAVT